MSLLPELDDSGNLKKQKQLSPFVPRTRTAKKFLEWKNLLENRCPSCGEAMKKENDRYTCHNHNDRPFTIPSFKYTKIIRDLRERGDFDSSFINFKRRIHRSPPYIPPDTHPHNIPYCSDRQRQYASGRNVFTNQRVPPHVRGALKPRLPTKLFPTCLLTLPCIHMDASPVGD
jgi:hypothetical protein